MRRCQITGCEEMACVHATWLGKVQWSGFLCLVHLDEMWGINHGLVTIGQADIILEELDELGNPRR